MKRFSVSLIIGLVQLLICVWVLCDQVDCRMPDVPVLHHLLEFAQNHVHWGPDAIQPSHPLSSSSSHAFNLSQHQGLFQWVGSSQNWPKYWSFSFSISPSNDYSGLISFRMDWFHFLAVQGTLKSLLHHHSLKAPNSLVLRLLYGTKFTSIYDYWANHNFDYMNLCWQSNTSAF